MDRANPPVMLGPELAGTELLGLLGLLESLLGLCLAACCLAGGMAHIVASPAWISVAGGGRHSSFNQIGTFVRLIVWMCTRSSYTPDWVKEPSDCMRGPDWQIGCFSRLARLASEPDCQIGVFDRLECFFAQTLVRALPKQDARLSSMPDGRRLFFFRFEGFRQIGQIGFIFRSPDWIRLSSVPDCQILPDWARQIGARMTSTYQYWRR